MLIQARTGGAGGVRRVGAMGYDSYWCGCANEGENSIGLT